MIALVLVAVAYLIGSIPGSFLAGKWARGIDLREHGSGNLGATNAFRVLGAKVAAPVMLFDMFKGFAPAYAFPRIDGQDSWLWALAYGSAAIVGHVFSIYMGFRGGKGVATAAGVFLAIAPKAMGPAFLVWLVVLAIWRMVSLASIAAAATLIAALLVWEERVPVQLLGVAIALFVVIAHRANIKRILRGEEHRFGRRNPVPDSVHREEG